MQLYGEQIGICGWNNRRGDRKQWDSETFAFERRLVEMILTYCGNVLIETQQFSAKTHTKVPTCSVLMLSCHLQPSISRSCDRSVFLLPTVQKVSATYHEYRSSGCLISFIVRNCTNVQKSAAAVLNGLISWSRSPEGCDSMGILGHLPLM